MSEALDTLLMVELPYLIVAGPLIPTRSVTTSRVFIIAVFVLSLAATSPLRVMSFAIGHHMPSLLKTCRNMFDFQFWGGTVYAPKCRYTALLFHYPPTLFMHSQLFRTAVMGPHMTWVHYHETKSHPPFWQNHTRRIQVQI